MQKELQILLVEDNPADAELVQLRLARGTSGVPMTIVWEERLSAALEHIKRERFDLVLLDLNLPDSAGVETISRVSSVAPGVPIVVLTGMEDDELGLRAVRAGAEDFVSKGGTSPVRLLQAIRQAHERRRLRGQLRRIVGRSPVAMVVETTQGEVVFANPAAEELLGRPEASLVGGQLGLPLSLDAMGEIDIPRGNGELRTAEMHTTNIEWDGAPAVLVSLFDVTESRQLAELRRYHSPAVVQCLIEQRHVVHPLRLMQGTVLFADVVGFTRRAESMEPLAVAVMLEEILGALTEAVFSHDGTLDKYLGDGLMAVFGAPLPSDDHPQCAARSALRMKEMIREKLAHHDLELHIGINSGELLSGRLGCQRRLEYTVLGDTVNVASRLCDLCPPGEILVGEETRRLLGEDFGLAGQGSKRLHNRRVPIEVYRLGEERVPGSV